MPLLHSTASPLKPMLKPMLLAALLCFAAVAQNNQPQQNQQSKPAKSQETLRIETELVQIDLVVTDKQGKLVRDLKRKDFEMFEDGKKRQITHFAIGNSAQPARWLTTEKRKPAETNSGNEVRPANEIKAGRHIVLAVDDYHLSAGSLGFVKQSLIKFIAEQMVAGDQVAVISTSGNVALFQQFTQERDILERAINRLTVQTRTAADNTGGPRISEYLAELIEFGDRQALEIAINEIVRVEGTPASEGGGSGGGGDSRLGSGRQGGRSGQGSGSGQAGGGQGSGGQSGGNTQVSVQREMLVSRAKTYARMILAHNANYTRATLDTLEGVIRSLRPLAGRKMLVLLSDGFFLGGAGINSQIYDTRKIADAATRAGVVIYSIDARGLVAEPPGGDATQPSVIDQTFPGAQIRIEQSAINAKRDGMGVLAEETGGSLYFNNNDLNVGLQRVLDANETYYVLAYEPPESRRDGQFHKIEVRIAGHPELKVRTRNGYFAPTEKPEEKPQEKRKAKSADKLAQEAKAEKEKQMATGLGSLFPLREIPIEMAVDFLNQHDGSFAMINAHIEAANLSFEEIKGRQQTVIDLKGVIFDEAGKVANSFNERMDISLKPEDLPLVIKQGFNYRRLATLKPGFYQTRIAIREDKTGRLGSATDWIEIPDIGKKQLTLSGILLSAAGKDSLSDMKNPGDTGDSGYKSRPSSAARRFKSGGDVDFLLFVYNTKIEKNAVDLVTQTQIFSGSKLVNASPISKLQPPPDMDLQRIPYGARVSLKGFDPGQYELRLMVIDRLTKATAYRRVNFIVEP